MFAVPSDCIYPGELVCVHNMSQFSLCVRVCVHMCVCVSPNPRIPPSSSDDNSGDDDSVLTKGITVILSIIGSRTHHLNVILVSWVIMPILETKIIRARKFK